MTTVGPVIDSGLLGSSALRKGDGTNHFTGAESAKSLRIE
jgi:hypothetical protein